MYPPPYKNLEIGDIVIPFNRGGMFSRMPKGMTYIVRADNGNEAGLVDRSDLVPVKSTTAKRRKK